MKQLISTTYLLICATFLPAQSSINVAYINDPIVLDGILDEAIWQSDKYAPEPFHQYFPTDSLLAEDQTEIRMAYDDVNLYISIVCHSRGGNYTIPTLKRDYRAGGNDNITILIDPFNDGANAFMFGTNPAGVQREGLISGGGNTLNGFSTSWDNKWKCETKTHDNKYVSEMAIPFSTLRFNKSNTTWRFNCYRFDMQSNERTTLVQIPRNQWIFNLGYMIDMNFEQPINAKSSNISIIPFATAGLSRDAETNEPTDFTASIGGDAKIAITSGLNLDITANPDFSQVEVDRQVTNLSRFEIFFPERRQFFLENADLFGSFGSPGINPFFSRRIGIATDTATDETIQNTIYGGLRLSGKLNRDWRVGLLNMATQKDDQAGQPSINFTVGAVQRRVGERSNIGLILVNKQAINPEKGDAVDAYNRVVGIDYNLATADNLYSGKAFLHRSFSTNSNSAAFAHGLRLEYNKRRYLLSWRHNYVGEDYDAQTGFVRRTDFYQINPRLRLFFYPDGKVNRLAVYLRTQQTWKPSFGNTDGWIQLGANFEFANNSRLELVANRRYIYLFDEFDPTGTDAIPLAEDSEHSFSFFTAEYRSDNSKLLSFRLNPYIGQYFDGQRYGSSGAVSYRVEPYGSLAFNFNYNIFDMDYLEDTQSTLLLGPRLDLTFRKDLFFTAFVQYNSQDQNTNINTRLQWRFAPVSDFFLVYADNYFTGNPADPADQFTFKLRNRSIVAKVTYWLNM